MSRPTERRPRRTLGLLIAATFAVGAVLAVPTAAQADGYNTVWSHGAAGTTALGVYGSSTTVNSVRVSHGDGAQLYNYCGFQSRVKGTLAAGTAYSSTFGYTAGCTPAPYFNDKSLGHKFKSGTNIRGDSYHQGAWAPGVAQVGIWA